MTQCFQLHINKRNSTLLNKPSEHFKCPETEQNVLILAADKEGRWQGHASVLKCVVNKLFNVHKPD